MINYSIFNRRVQGLDVRVWRTMLTAIILSIGLLGYKIMDSNKCIPFNIDMEKSSAIKDKDSFYFTGENIRFIASIPSEEIVWDFNDNSSGVTKGSFVIHTFIREGKYYVTADNKECKQSKLVTVKRKPQKIVNEEPPPSRPILGISSTVVGKVEEFISPDLADSIYVWIVLSHPEMGARNEEKAKFKFDIEGTYTIQLTLDNDRIKSYSKDVYVEAPHEKKAKMPEDVGPLIPKKLPKRVDPPPLPPPVASDSPHISKSPAIIKIADEVFKGYLQKVVDYEMTESEFYKYLCGAGSTPVLINGDGKNTKTFSLLCQEISGKKARKTFLSRKKAVTIKSVRLLRDETSCVNKIEVNY